MYVNSNSASWFDFVLLPLNYNSNFSKLGEGKTLQMHGFHMQTYWKTSKRHRALINLRRESKFLISGQISSFYPFCVLI